MATTNLKSKDLTSTIDKPGLVLFDCWAPWCAPCRHFAPIFERVSEKFPDVTFAKVNVDEEPAIAQSFGVQGIPLLVAFRDGVPLFSQAGMLADRALEELITQLKALDMADVRRRIAEAEVGDGSAARPGDAVAER